jgi:hypothetical protein
MAEFLFIFEFESPEDWRINQLHGTDFESSEALWVEAENEAAAIDAGRTYAERFVGELFSRDPAFVRQSWLEANYAYWIEAEPLKTWSADEMRDLPRIKG